MLTAALRFGTERVASALRASPHIPAQRRIYRHLLLLPGQDRDLVPILKKSSELEGRRELGRHGTSGQHSEGYLLAEAW